MNDDQHSRKDILANRRALALSSRRGREIRRKLVKEPWMLSTIEAARRLGVSSRRLSELRRQGNVLALQAGRGPYKYPDWQFDEALPRERVQAIMHLMLKTEDPWSVLRFFMTPEGTLQGRLPKDPLRAGEFEGVTRAAIGYLET